MRRDRRLNTDRNADHDAERVADAGKQQRARKPFGQDIEDRTAVIHGIAEIAMQHVHQVAVQPLKERLIELEALFQRGAKRRRHRHIADHGLDRIAGNELQQAEDQDDDADQKQHSLRHMSRGMPQHQHLVPIASRADDERAAFRRPHIAMHHEEMRPSISHAVRRDGAQRSSCDWQVNCIDEQALFERYAGRAAA
jgi:hypothetical protein